MTSTETQNNASQQQQMMQQQQQQQQAAQQQLAAAMFAAQSGASPNQAMQAAHAANALDLEAKARSLLNFDYRKFKTQFRVKKGGVFQLIFAFFGFFSLYSIYFQTSLISIRVPRMYLYMYFCTCMFFCTQ